MVRVLEYAAERDAEHVGDPECHTVLSKTGTPIDRRRRRLAHRHRRQARIPCSLSVNRQAVCCPDVVCP
jgi:hypothetical protein